MAPLTSSPATDLTAALRRAGVGDVDDSGLARSLYSSDGSLYRVLPRAVVRPRHPDEIEATLAVCRELGVPFTARGAGRSKMIEPRLAGQPIIVRPEGSVPATVATGRRRDSTYRPCRS